MRSRSPRLAGPAAVGRRIPVADSYGFGSQGIPMRRRYRAGMVERISRSGLLVRLAGLVGGVAGLGAWRAASAPASRTVSCVLTPELTGGPYYLSGEKLRRNITEGRPGTRLDLRLSVLDATTCRPVPGALVDIWHADALGIYSGFGAGSSNRTFMRGVQRTDRSGLAVFRTVYPGWYQGRTVHIHVKVHVGGNVVHTGQLFFSDTLTDAVYRRAPYTRRPGRSTRNRQDAIFQSGGRQSLLAVRRKGSGYVGSIDMGIRR
jgi:protocatechuate 3,4-dioxygenase beta subunit